MKTKRNETERERKREKGARFFGHYFHCRLTVRFYYKQQKIKEISFIGSSERESSMVDARACN
jgi:hypothetical protein